MARNDRPSPCTSAALLAVIVVFLLVATPISATESEVQAPPAEDAKSGAQAAGEAEKAEAGEPADDGVCLDTDTGSTTGANTLEDVFSLSAGDSAALLKLTAAQAAGAQPAQPLQEEVRWAEVEPKAETKTEKQAETEAEPDSAQADD